ncbi:hypothetical protein ACFL29_01715 [Patescibacteria group bacterium]
MTYEIPKPDSPEEHEYADSHQTVKDILIKKFNKIIPDKNFDVNEAFLQIDKNGNLKLAQKLEKVERHKRIKESERQAGGPEFEQFHPEEKQQEYTFDPEDAKNIFKKLDEETQKNYIKGLEASIRESERIIEKKPDTAGLTDEERMELEKNMQEEKEVMEATKKLIENLK